MSEHEHKNEQEAQQQELEAEPEVLIFGKYKSLEEAEKAYKEAERKIHEQAMELKALRESQESVLPEPGDDLLGWEGLDPIAGMQAAAEQAFRPEAYLSKQERLAAISQAAARHVDERFGSAPGQLTVEEVAVQGAALVKSVLPTWDEETQARAVETLAKTPELAAAAQQALSSGDPSGFATLLMAASHQAQQQTAASLRETLSEREKLAAQTASGAGPARIESSDAAEEWRRIVQAGTGSYSDLRRGS